MLIGLRDQYKMAALKAKKAGQEDTAKSYIRTAKVKQFTLYLTLLSLFSSTILPS